MTDTLYDIYLTGKLLENTTAEKAQQYLSVLFKIPKDTAARYFDGKAHLIKRAASKEDAVKYKAALHKIGIVTAFKPCPSAERHDSNIQSDEKKATDIPPNTPSQDEELKLAPQGTAVLTEAERQAFTPRDIDTSHIKLASAFSSLEPDTATAPVTAPNTSYLSVAPVGENLVQAAAKPADIEMSLEHLTLAPPGSELEALKPEQEMVNPDISSISLAPEGGLLVEPKPRAPVSMPDTEHLSLVKN